MRTVNPSIQELEHDILADTERRKLLVIATSVVGGAGLLTAAYPFVASLEPSALARAQGGPVQADISTLAVGELRTVAWRGKPVWLMRRSEEMIAALERPCNAPATARSGAPAAPTPAPAGRV